jgi:hypothetical protein
MQPTIDQLRRLVMGRSMPSSPAGGRRKRRPSERAIGRTVARRVGRRDAIATGIGVCSKASEAAKSLTV